MTSYIVKIKMRPGPFGEHAYEFVIPARSPRDAGERAFYRAMRAHPETERCFWIVESITVDDGGV